MDDERLRAEVEAKIARLADAYLKDGLDGLHRELVGQGRIDPVHGNVEIVIGLSPNSLKDARVKALAVGQQVESAFLDVDYHKKVENITVKRVVIEETGENSFSFGHRDIDEAWEY